MSPVVTQIMAMKRMKRRIAKPTSFSAPSTAMANPQAKTIGNTFWGGTMSRCPTRSVGVDSSSRLAAKYDAKKNASRILASSTGWKDRRPTWTQRRAP